MGADRSTVDKLLERFPALASLARRRRRRHVPFVPQATATDCGAACLAMVLGYHGKRVDLAEVRRSVGSDRDGTNALMLTRAARHWGLRARGVRVALDGLAELPRASLLHWAFRHYVVFDRMGRNAVDIVDPASGRRRIPLGELSRLFTGVALTFAPTDAFAPSAGRSLRQRYWSFIRHVVTHTGVLTRILVTSVLVQICGLALPLLTGVLVDQVVPAASRSLLPVVGLALGVMVAMQLGASLVRAHLLLHLRSSLDVQMTLGFVDHLVDLPYGFFQLRPAGDLMMRINSNALVREILTSGAISGVLDGTLVAVYLVLLLLVSPSLAALALGLGVAHVGLFLLVRRPQRELAARNLETQARSESFQVELLTGMETLKAMGAERRAAERWSHLFTDTLNVSLDRGRTNALFDSAMAGLRLASPLALLLYGGLLVLDGQLSLGTMLAAASLAAGFLAPLATLVSTGVQLQVLGSTIERLNDVLDTPPEQPDGGVVRAERLAGHIVVDRVGFRYGPAAPPVVRDVSLAILPGQKVALVGRSGSGKSTLARLLLGLYPPTEGSIRFDGHELAQLDCRAVRAQLGVVTQDPQLFSGTIRDNILLSDPSLPLDRAIQAARLARIHDEIAAMPLGYDTILADRGLSLSGGQRQRIALARALASEPSILLLDEATSDLDAVTEREIQRALAALRCTQIVIAHRLSTVADADQILVVNAGTIVERGSYAELATLGGAFSELAAAQTELGRGAKQQAAPG